MRDRWPLLVLLLAPGAACAQDRADVASAIGSITPGDIARRVAVIAHDSMRGRATPSPQLDQVAAYVAGEFSRLGLEPLGDDGGFVQRYWIEDVELDTTQSGITVKDGPTWRVGRDVRFPFTSVAEGTATVPVVMVTGEGDPRTLDRARLRGAVVLVVLPLAPNGAPTSPGVALLSALTRSQAAAVVAVAPLSDAAWQASGALLGRRSERPAWAGETGTLAVVVRDRTVASVLAQHGVDLARARRTATVPTATPLPGLELAVTVRRSAVSRVSAPNVVGLLQGSDPTLRQEYLVYSAHMDHVGVGHPDVTGDSIYNGADDDASGTVAVVETAEAFACLRTRPRRSVIFLLVSGEERGLWGSEHFTSHGPVRAGQMVAALNVDMVGRNWKDTIVAIGKEHSDLGATLARVNAAHPELGMTAVDDLWPQQRYYYRSDHYNFARQGVPILFFFNGEHADYHRPSDHADKIDAEKESRIVKLIFLLGLDIANRAERPRWNPDSYRQIVEGTSR